MLVKERFAYIIKKKKDIWEHMVKRFDFLPEPIPLQPVHSIPTVPPLFGFLMLSTKGFNSVVIS